MKKIKKPLVIIIILILISIIFTIIVGNSATNQTNDILQSPNIHHLFGTDSLGRDIFLECLVAIKSTFIISLIITILSGLLGIIIGSLCATSHKIVNEIIDEFINIIISLPMIFVFLLIFSSYQISSFLVILVLSLTMWTGTAKIVKSEVKSCMQEKYVIEQLALGESKIYIIIKHVIPHIYKPLISNLALTFSSACITESSLSFIGIKCANLTLGTILNYGKNNLFSAWWISVFPSLFIIILCYEIMSIVGIINKEMK